MPLFTQRESRPAWFHETDQSQWLRPGLGDYLGAAAGDAWEGLPTVALGRLGEMAALSAQATGTDVELDENGTPVISHERQPMSILPTEEQASIIDAYGLKGQITPQPGYSRDMLDVVMERKKAELARQATREAAPGIYAPLGFATELGISLFDPINVASAFVPVVGEARVLSMLGRASGALGRAGVRAGVGTVEGAVGAAMIEPVIALAQTQQQADYDMSDALGNIAFGAAFGAALHPAAGAVGDWLRSRRGQRQPWQIMPDTDESLALMRRHRDAIRDARIFAGADEARAAEESAAAAALFDARARRWAYDFNQPVAAFYDRYMPDYRAVREGKDALSQAALYEQTPMGDAARASLERDVHDFGAAVDNIVAAGKLPSNPVKMLGQTPLVMRLLGRDTVTGKAAAQGGVYAAPHVFDGTHPNMTPEMWKQIPAAMADPIAVFDSDSPAGRARGDLVFMLELTDANGATVVVPVALQAKGKLGARINIVKSAYSKESGGVPSNHWFMRQLKKNARYVNGQKWKHWRDIGSGADSPLVVPTNASGNTIHTEADLVNLRQGNAALYQPSAEARDLLNADVDAWAQKSGSSNLPGRSIPGESEPLRQDATASVEERIPVSDDGVNLYILSEPATRGGDPRARVTFDAAEGGRAVIEFFSAADASSAPHELYHIFRREMAESAARPDAPQRVREDWARIEEFVGAEPGQTWTRAMEEKFARAGERFLLEGKAPTPALQGVFERLRQWFLELYANADAAGLHISPAMREVFGNMLSVPAEQGDMAFRKALGELLSRPVDPVEPAAVPPLPADAPPLETMQAMTVEAEQDLGRALGELEQALPGGAANLRAIYDAETALIDADIQKSVQVRTVLEEAARCYMRN